MRLLEVLGSCVTAAAVSHSQSVYGRGAVLGASLCSPGEASRDFLRAKITEVISQSCWALLPPAQFSTVLSGWDPKICEKNSKARRTWMGTKT